MFKSILTFLIPLTLLGCSDVTSNYHGKGTMKSWVKEQAQSAGLELRWNMNGDYDIPELHKKELKNIHLGQQIKLLQRRMTLDNLNKQLEWPIYNQSQKYPYDIMVATAICKNTLVFAEVPDLNIYTKSLLEGKFEGCVPVDVNLGLKTPIAPPSSVQTFKPPLKDEDSNSIVIPSSNVTNSLGLQMSISTNNGKLIIPIEGDPNEEVPKMNEIKK